MDEHVGAVGGLIAGVLVTLGVALNAESLFPDAYSDVLEIEGGYVDHPNDRGGATNWGITEEVARLCGYRGSMKDMPAETAIKCAWKRYWKPLGLDAIATRQDSTYKPVAEKLFEIGYHAGTRRPGIHLQRCLNIFNNGGRQYPDLRVDGKIGRSTIAALNAFKQRRGAEGSKTLAGCITADYCAFLMRLAQRDPTQEAFAYGWMRKRCAG